MLQANGQLGWRDVQSILVHSSVGAGSLYGGVASTSDTFGWQANRDNDYGMDRRAQREQRAYSGVFGFSAQDYSLQESMGTIQDHEAEKLLPTDKAIVMARRMLHEAAVALEQGQTPPALDASAQHVRPAGVLLPKEQDPVAWAREHLADATKKPVFSL